MSYLPDVELRTDGPRPELLIDGHLVRGVTNVTMTREVRGPVRVTVEIITDRFRSTAVVPVTVVASDEALEQEAVLAELRDEEGMLHDDQCQLGTGHSGGCAG